MNTGVITQTVGLLAASILTGAVSSAEAKKAILAALDPPLSAADRAQREVVFRRLNRAEYENTIRDLFRVKVEVAAMLPEDAKAHGFDNAFHDFLAKLQSADDGGGTLLDRTTVLLGSNLGNASSHSNENLPIILAGGGFKHGQHLAFSQTKNTPLPNLLTTILQRLGLETDRFASSTGTLTGLEMAGDDA